MKAKDNQSAQAAQLRKQAEEADSNNAVQSTENLEALSPEELRRMLHELRVHQIELEMQNEELRRTQTELDAARARYFDLYDLAPVGYCTLSEKGLIQEANLTAANLLGVTRSELDKKPLGQFILKEDQDAYYLHRKQLFEIGEPKSIELRMVKRDGTQFWAHLEMTDLHTANGTTESRLVVSDITERKLIEESLEESEEKYRLLYESTQMPIAIFETETLKFLSVNNAFVDKYGYTREEFLTMTILEIRPDFERDRVKQSVKINDKGLVNLGEYLHKKKNGEIIPVEILRNDLVFEGKKAKIVFANDITERKNNEQALRQTQKLESIGTLAGGIAHDFNNLLNAVLGQSALAIGKLPNESPARDHISKSIKAAERATDLTKQLLAYSGKGKFLTEEIDINRLVNENVQMLETSIPKTALLQFELGSHPLHILGDVGQIQQVVMNLIINAGEAMGGNPGCITVHTDSIILLEDDAEYRKHTATPLSRGRYALLRVSDNGCGMSEGTLSRVFDPFFTTKFTGRGLGLAAVLGIIRGHKGGIRIESKAGEGTRFDVVFPSVENHAIAKTPDAAPATIIDGNDKTVLLIDDEPAVLEVLTDIFSDAKFSVISASNPIEGIELYRRHQGSISVVILDYSMPGMDGKAAFEELITINREVNVLLCSGYTEEEMMAAFGTVRPAGFLHKPYKPAGILERVAKMLAE